jgi:hypothetical protein
MQQDDRIASKGIDRRQLIKRSAAVLGAAWVAPVIVESLASPVAAVTGPTFAAGCYRIDVTMQNTCNPGDWSDGLAACIPLYSCPSSIDSSNSQTLAQNGLVRTSVATCESTTQDISFDTIGSNCTIITAWSQKPNNTCQDPSGSEIVISNAGHSVLFKAGLWDNQFRIIMNCT